MSKFAIFTLFLFVSIFASGQQLGDPTAIFEKNQYKKDLRQLKKLITKNHPRKYAFISKKEFNQLAKSQFSKITDSTSIGQFHWICQELAASIQCGHTFISWPRNFGSMPDSLLFPLDTWTINKKLFITDSRNNADKLDAGTEILSINDVKVEVLIKAMYNISPSDGNIESSKRFGVNYLFSSLCPKYFNYPDRYTVQVKVKGEIRTIQLDKYVRKQENSRPVNDCSDGLCLKIDSTKSLGILKVQTFNFYEDDFAIFKEFIDSAFLELNTKKIENLIIDLRNNGGGDSKCGSYLIEHFADKPFCYWPTNTDAVWQNDLHNTIQPNLNGFKGKPYILINGGCFSTTGHVCSIVKEHQLGILVGEEAGSTFLCNDNSLHGSLKHTGIIYRVPQMTFKTCVTSLPANKGVLPDVEILKTITDVLDELDPVMSYVLEQFGSN